MMRLKVLWRAYKVPASGGGLSMMGLSMMGLSMMGEPPGEN
jgi:hypothetical protein